MAKMLRAQIALVVSFLMICPPTLQAQSKPIQAKGIAQRQMPEMLTYYQLTRLSERERAAYIEEVVSLFRYLEARENGKVATLPPSKTTLVTDIWSLLLRGPSVQAEACPKGEESINMDGKHYCAASCKEGYQKAGIVCKLSSPPQCSFNCVIIAKNPDWVLPTPDNKEADGNEIVGRDGKVAGRTTEKTGRVTQNPVATPEGGDKPTTDLAEAEEKAPVAGDDKTPKTTDQKPVTPKDACYEIACPATDSQYRFTVKEDFNKRVTETNDARCINAGLVGKYDISGNKKCLPVQKFKIGSLDLSCKSGTTMCNPLLFGLEKQDPATPHCITIGLEMTKQCYDKAAGAQGARDFWKNPSVTHEAMAEEWDKITKFLREDICTEERSAKYHCLECALIAKRLAELNKMVDACPKANKCGDKVICASRWKDVKGLETGETNGAAGAGTETQK